MPTSLTDFDASCGSGDDHIEVISDATIRTLMVTDATFDNLPIVNGNNYHFAVRTVAGTVKSAWSTPPTTASPMAATTPDPPTAVMATAGDGTIDVSWTAPTDTTGLINYIACNVRSALAADAAAAMTICTNTADGSGNAGLISATDTTANFSNRSNGLVYYVFVRARYAGGSSVWVASDPATVTPTAAPQASDATLSALTVTGTSAVGLDPVFAGDTYAYTASVANSESQLIITATPNDANAATPAISVDTDSDATLTRVDLAEGANVITITVTAEDTSTQDYVVTVTREAAAPALSSDATLSFLQFAAADIAPTFSAETLAYTARINFDSSGSRIIAEATHTDATVAITADAPAAIAGAFVTSLPVGDTAIIFTVTAADGMTTRTYVLTVTRDAEPPAVGTTLSALAAYAGAMATGTPLTLTPAFSADSGQDTATVVYLTEVTAAVTQVTVAFTTTDPTSRTENSKGEALTSPVTFDLRPAGLLTTWALNVLPPGSSVGRKEFTIRVTRAAAAPGVPTGVTAARSATADQIDVTWTAPATGTTPAGYEICALTTGNFGAGYAASCTARRFTTVAAGTTSVTIHTSLESAHDDDTLNDFSFTGIADNIVSRIAVRSIHTAGNSAWVAATPDPLPARLSSDAELSSLIIAPSTTALAPAFSRDITTYTVGVAADTATVFITTARSHSGASVAIDVDGTTASDNTMVPLAVGDNTVTVTVTAEDGTTQDYVITITRAAAAGTTPGVPTVVGATGGDASIAVTWTPPTGTPAPDGFHVCVLSPIITATFDAGCTTDGQTFATVTGATTGSVTIGEGSGQTMLGGLTLTNGVTFRVAVRAYVGSGASQAASAWVPSTPATVTTAVPPVFGTDATLQSLTIDSGTLTPPFSSDVRTYTASVGNAVTTLDVDALETDATAELVTIASDRDPAASFDSVALAEGANVITITITAEDGTTMLTYTLTVTRATAPAAGAPGAPTAVTAVRGAPHRVDVSWTAPATAPDGYQVCVLTQVQGNDFDGDCVAGRYAEAAASPLEVHNGSRTIDANTNDFRLGGSSVQDNLVNNIAVRAFTGDGAARMFSAWVADANNPLEARLSDDVTLTRLELTDGTLSPAFTSGSTRTTYTAGVANSVTSTTLRANATDSGARPVITSAQDSDVPNTPEAFFPSRVRGVVDLVEGANVITVTVTAEDDSTQDYVITITREAAAGAPGAPTAVTAVRGSTDQIDVRWTAATSGATADGFEVCASHFVSSGLSSCTPGRIGSAGATATEFTVSSGGEFASATINENTPVLVAVRAVVGTGAGRMTSAWAAATPNPVPARTIDRTATTLEALAVHAGGTALTLTPPFTATLDQSGATIAFTTAPVPASVTQATISFTTTNPNARVQTEEGATITSPYTFDLNTGDSSFLMDVLAQEGSGSKAFSFQINRAAVTPSSDATLSTLAIYTGNTATGTPLTLTPPFSATSGQTADEVTYDAGTVPNATTHVTIAWTTTENTATAVNEVGNRFRNPTTWTLNTGATLASSYAVTVTAPDGTTTKDFVFRVTREAATPGTRPTVSIAAVRASVTEGTDDDVSFTVTSDMDAPTGGLAVTVTLTGGDTFVAAGERQQTVTIAVGTRSATVTFPVTNDEMDEPNATVTAILASSEDFTDANSAMAMIVDDDAPALPTLTIAATNALVTEAAGAMLTFTVTSDTAAPTGGLPVTVTLTGANNFVAAGARTQTATIAAGATTVTVSFPITDDDVREGHATVTATLGASAAYTGDGATATATVRDDETPPMLTIAAANSPVTEADGAMIAFTITSDIPARDELSITVTLTNADNFVNAGARTRIVTLAADATTATVSFPITDDDVREGHATVTATLAAGASDAYTVGAPATAAVRDDDTPPDSETAALHVVLPEMARAMADSAVSAIKRRLEQAHRGAATRQATLGGVALGHRSLTDSVADLVTTHGRAVADGAVDVTALLTNSDFVLPLTAGDGPLSGAALWGRGDYRSLSGGDDTLNWDSDLAAAHLGVDIPLTDTLLAGAGLSWLEGAIDNNTTGSDYDLNLFGVHPYLGWQTGPVDFWATLGYGAGTLNTRAVDQADVSRDMHLRTAALGGSGALWQSDRASLRLKGDALITTLTVDGDADRPEVSVEAQRLRVTLEATGAPQTLGAGGAWHPTLEVGFRGDAGDGRTGGGLEIGGGVSYTHARFAADGRVRGLVDHSGGYREWGISGGLRLRPGAGGQGLSFTISPAYGDDAVADVQDVWQQSLPAAYGAATGATPGLAATRYRASLDTRVGYGLPLLALGGLLTPYSTMTLGATARYGVGLDWHLGAGLNLTLAGERRTPTGQTPTDNILLRGALNF
nr:cadherin-like beta sandwich domain-containing protein [uncultured Brevundimonas sp.]